MSLLQHLLAPSLTPLPSHRVLQILLLTSDMSDFEGSDTTSVDMFAEVIDAIEAEDAAEEGAETAEEAEEKARAEAEKTAEAVAAAGEEAAATAFPDPAQRKMSKTGAQYREKKKSCNGPCVCTLAQMSYYRQHLGFTLQILGRLTRHGTVNSQLTHG